MNFRAEDQEWVIYGEPSAKQIRRRAWEGGEWYGVQGFFDWLEKKTYKMHVRVLLSRYRTYTPCRGLPRRGGCSRRR